MRTEEQKDREEKFAAVLVMIDRTISNKGKKAVLRQQASTMDAHKLDFFASNMCLCDKDAVIKAA